MWVLVVSRVLTTRKSCYACWMVMPTLGIAPRHILSNVVSSRTGDVSAVSEANGTKVSVSLDLGSSFSIQPQKEAARGLSGPFPE